MAVPSKKIILYRDAGMAQGMDLSAFRAQWPEEFPLEVVESYNDVLQACTLNPTAVLIADADLSFVAEPLMQLRARFPEILRLVITGNTDPKALQNLYETQLMHKYFDAHAVREILSIQIQESLMLLQMVTERNKFLELSITDPVTQLTNHRFFQQKFRQELQKSKAKKESLSLLMIDVDHFKILNDQFGHPQGDMVLGMIAFELKKHLPPNASASRYGGEEFAVLLPKCTHSKAFQLAEQLRLAVTKISSIDFRLSISIGIASYPEHGLDADEILTIADHALYCAKRQGRNMSIVAGDGTY